MDVLVATGIFPPDIGGPATQTALLLAALPARGCRVRLVTYGPAGISRRLPRGVRHLAYFLACLARGRGCDVVLAQDPVPAGLPALLAARILRRPFVVRVPGDYAWEQAVQRFGVREGIDAFQSRRYGVRTELLRAVQRRVVRSADAVVVPSQHVKTLVSRWVGRSDPVHVVYNGVRLDPEEPASPPPGPGGPVLLTAARLVPWKGVRTLIELVAERPGWKLVVVGDGPQAAELRARARQLGAAVEFTGSVSRDELARRLRRASVFVLNTAYEGLSHQVVEAMHAGVPVVTTDCGGMSELVQDGKDGILVRPDDRAQLRSAIERLATDRDLREAIVANARAKARLFSIDRTVDGLLQVLRAVGARTR